MTRINTNVPALISINSLDRSNEALSTSLQRLSTGLRINAASDDPAGLIISETLRAQIGSINQAIDNSQRAANVLATAEGALGEVNSLLISIRELIVEAANTGSLSAEEIDANQLQIDSAIESITRIANTTAFGGQKLLNGTLGFQTSGVTAANIADVAVYAASFGGNSQMTVNLNITQSAETAYLIMASSALVGDSASIELSGLDGSEVFSFASGAAASAVSFAINQASYLTGVSAGVLVGSAAATTLGVELYSTGYGDDSFVSVEVLDGTFATLDAFGGSAATRDTGVDAAGELNGNTVTGKGNTLAFNSRALNLAVTLTDGFGGTTSFTIRNGGAMFQLSPEVNAGGQINIGIDTVTAAHLGRGDIGFLNSLMTGGANDLSSGNLTTAANITDAAAGDVATLRGRLGAFEKNVINTAISSLRVSLENVSAAESVIRDTDFATETAELTRSQILVAAGTSVLAAANASPQNVLSLL